MNCSARNGFALIFIMGLLSFFTLYITVIWREALLMGKLAHTHAQYVTTISVAYNLCGWAKKFVKDNFEALTAHLVESKKDFSMEFDIESSEKAIGRYKAFFTLKCKDEHCIAIHLFLTSEEGSKISFDTAMLRQLSQSKQGPPTYSYFVTQEKINA